MAEPEAYRISQLYRSVGVCFDDLVSQNPLMKRAIEEARWAASSDAPGLILGETGTGKNLMAQALHNGSARRDGPFCEVNCGGLSETLQESELFGHRKGAFTGATADRNGLLESAEGGTLFLNEIGDIPLTTQRKLLDVIEYKKYRKVGVDRESDVDIRIIGATNRDLGERRRAGEFRDDFYFRLSGFQVQLPPLRRRPEDIRPLAERFVREFSKRECKPIARIADDAIEVLLDYRWPGNVRELRYVIWRALLRAPGDSLERAQVLEALGRRDDRPAGPLLPLREVERSYLLKVLNHTNWNKSRTAGILEISRPALDRKIKAYELVKDET